MTEEPTSSAIEAVSTTLDDPTNETPIVASGLVDPDRLTGQDAPAAGSVVERTTRTWIIMPVLALALGGVALLDMVATVLRSSRFQYLDYWAIVGSSLNPDGSFAPRTLLVLQNEHPVAAARILYYLNLDFFGGDNRTLGAVVVGIVLVQIALIGYVSLRARLGTAAVVTIVGASTALLFSPQGIHNYQLSMSGAAWLSANLFAIAAFVVAQQRRVIPAVALGLAASASYGTGLMVWPALLAIVLLHPEGRRVTKLAPVIGGAAISYATFLSLYERPTQHAGAERSLTDLTSRSLSVLGSIPGATSTLSTVVALLLVAGGIAVISGRRAAATANRPFELGLALAIYSGASAGLIGLARGDMGTEVGTSSRYASLSALFIIAIVLLASSTKHRRWWHAGAVAAALAGVAGGASVKPVMADLDARQQEAAIAAFLGQPDGYDTFAQADVDFYSSLGHYPYNDDFDLDCGVTGSVIETLPFTTDPAVVGVIDTQTTARNEFTTRVSGWISPPDRWQCLVLIDETNTVVGAAASGLMRGDLRAVGHFYRGGFAGVAIGDPLTLRAAARTDEGFRLLAGEIYIED